MSPMPAIAMAADAAEVGPPCGGEVWAAGTAEVGAAGPPRLGCSAARLGAAEPREVWAADAAEVVPPVGGGIKMSVVIIFNYTSGGASRRNIRGRKPPRRPPLSFGLAVAGHSISSS